MKGDFSWDDQVNEKVLKKLCDNSALVDEFNKILVKAIVKYEYGKAHPDEEEL